MNKEIYEKKHIFLSLINAVAHIIANVCVVLIVSGLLFGFINFQPWERWISICLGLFLLTSIVIDTVIRGRRYIDLSIRKRPAIIINDEHLQIYYPFGKSTIIPWSEIDDFKVLGAKGWTSCYPIYKDQARNKKRYIFNNVYRDSIRTDYLAIPEEEFLSELKKHLKTK